MQLHFKRALLPDGWANDVEFVVAHDGVITQINTNSAKAGSGCDSSGIAIPGLANLHSHAHQRAMAGFAERAGSDRDSFWTWRSTMYQFIQAMQPHQLQAVAAQLYMEMLLAGYTRVAEFQYLHHQQSGQPYEDCAEMSLQVLQAAESAGIGITCLPVHYQFSGFGEQEISPQQRRFFTDPEAYLRLVKRLELHLRPNANQSLGIAGHSLRATSASTFNSILQALQNEEYGREIPVHMHIAEQIKEVEDCVSWSGMRCVEYCLEQFPVDQHWCLIHATHMTETEAQELAQSGAVVGLCPTTEANLGDGLFNAMPFLDAGGKIGIGSDSHISVSAVEELRWLEYGQRLMNHSRNQLARGSDRSTGRALVELAAIGGAQACGHPAGTLEVGKRADLVVLDDQNPLLIEREGDTLLDSWVFSGNANSVRDVYVGGQHVVQDGRHPKQEIINQTFRAAMRELTA